MSKIIPGTYKIEYNQLPLAAQRVFQVFQSSRLFMKNFDGGDSALWVLTQGNDQGEWYIHNKGLRDHLFADVKGDENTRVIGRHKGVEEMAWKIEPFEDGFCVYYPGTDLVWTAIQSPVKDRVVYELFLRPNGGSSEQKFELTLLSSSEGEK